MQTPRGARACQLQGADAVQSAGKWAAGDSGRSSSSKGAWGDREEGLVAAAGGPALRAARRPLPLPPPPLGRSVGLRVRGVIVLYTRNTLNTAH